MKKVHYFYLIAFLVHTHITYGQGCSDAGFCTLNGLKPSADSIDMSHKNSIAIGLSKGEADHSISILAAYLEYHRQWNKKISMDVKLTCLSQTGNQISSTGLSDVYITGNYSFAKRATVIIGAKIPLHDGNKQSPENLSLPMDYQSSLGTFDLIVGTGYQIKKLKLTAAWQQPIIQNNNHFLSNTYPINSVYTEFQSTNDFVRSGDILLRANYPFRFAKKFTVTPGVLNIYHFNEDKYTDITGMQHSIDGSKGTTLNGTIYFDYAINKSNFIDLNIGKPFITRKTRPDGLTREYIITLEYKFKF